SLSGGARTVADVRPAGGARAPGAPSVAALLGSISCIAPAQGRRLARRNRLARPRTRARRSGRERLVLESLGCRDGWLGRVSTRRLLGADRPDHAHRSCLVLHPARAITTRAAR